MARRRLDSSCPIPFAADAVNKGDVCTHSFDTFIQETESRLFKCGTWICKNDQFFDNVNHLGPADFVARLKENDDAAWECIRKYVVLPIFKQKKFGEMAWKKSAPFDDACGYVYEVAMAEGHLADLSSPKKLKSWLQYYVRKYIYEYYSPKEMRTDSIEVRFARRQKSLFNGLDHTIEDPISRIVDRKQADAQKDALGRDEKLLIQRKFHALWKKNPREAYVLMFRMKDRLPSKDIKTLCNVSSSQNVDKLLERAKDSMAFALAGKRAVKHPKRKATHVN